MMPVNSIRRSYSGVRSARNPTAAVTCAVLNRADFFRRPAISRGAGAAHQHRPLAVAQTAGFKERLDGLLVVDDGVCACPVRAPQAAVETPGIEHAGERVPDVREGIRFPGQRAGAADL